jgi:hypothetical protein
MQNNLSYVKQLSNKMKDHKFMLSYRGNITSDITMSILALTERKLELDGTEISTKKKVFNVMVECLQNISIHAEEKNNTTTDGLFMIGRIDNDYIMYSGNTILNENVNSLKDKLISVNEMTNEELKELYKKLLVNNKLSNKGTAGLGLIDIAKKSGNKLEYNFNQIDSNYTYFTLRTHVTLKTN